MWNNFTYLFKSIATVIRVFLRGITFRGHEQCLVCMFTSCILQDYSKGIYAM